MKKKMTIAIAVICMAGFIFGGAVMAQAATTKSTIIGFADMAASVEKSYGTMLELDLTLRGGEPVYKANVIISGKRVLVYFNAVTGTEIERKSAVTLDEDEAKIYNDYNIASSVSGQGKTISEVAAGAQTSYSAEAKISYERAKEIALAKVGGGTVKEIELDYEHGVLIYEVAIKYNGVEYEVDVNASTGEVVKFKSDHSTNNSAPASTQKPSTSGQTQSSSSTAQISYERAKEIALAKVGGGTVKEIELERKNGQLVYEVEVKYNGREYELKIDAATGEILKYKIDDEKQ